MFKKLIRDIIREELDYKFTALEKKIDEVLVSNGSNVIVEDRTSQLVSSPTKKITKQKSPIIPNTKDATLNAILAETATAGDWKKMNEEPEVKSVTENTQNLPNHLTEAFTKDYSEVMKKVEEKAKFKNGA